MPTSFLTKTVYSKCPSHASHLRTFAVAIFLFSVHLLDAQTIECGTPDMTLAKRDSILQELSSTTVASTSSSPWKMGIWFYHLRYSDGSTAHQNYDPEQIIDELNQYYTGLFEFSICGISNIDNDSLVTIDRRSSSSDLQTLWNEVSTLNDSLSDNCVRVFLCGGIIAGVNATNNGYTYPPLDSAQAGVLVVDLIAKLWAHELGHYFGLPHTYAGGPAGQYVDSLVTINGELYSCLQTGDGFCDTNADVDCLYSTSQCSITSCSPVNDPNGVPYNPDLTLLMGDYLECSSRFTNEQRQLMRTLYLYLPAYEAVRNAPAECIGLKYGFVERNCSDYKPIIDDPYQHLINLPVELRDGSNTCNGQDNKTDTLGRYLTMPCSLAGPLRRILPDKDFGNDPLNGVSTFDLLLINKHILGIDIFQNPFQMIAADANNSASITTFDIVEIRKLILGIITNMKAGSWRYMPKLCTSDSTFLNDFYANPFDAEFTDPFQTAFIRKYSNSGLPILNTQSWMDHVSLYTTSSISNNKNAWSFTGIKFGDVNCNANSDDSSVTPDDHEFLVESGSNTSIPSNSTKIVQITASSPYPVVAWQFGATYASDTLTISDISAGTIAGTFDEENFHYIPADSTHESGQLRAVWYSTDGDSIDIDDEILFEIEVSAQENIGRLEQIFQLDKEILPFLFYDADGAIIPDVSLTLGVVNPPLGFQATETANPTRPALQVKAYPQPFSTQINFECTLPEDELVWISLFNTVGQPVDSKEIALPAGLQEIQMPGLEQLSSGFYWYMVKAGSRVAWGKLNKR